MIKRNETPSSVELANMKQLAPAAEPQDADGKVRMYGQPGMLQSGWEKDSNARAARLKQAYGERH